MSNANLDSMVLTEANIANQVQIELQRAFAKLEGILESTEGSGPEVSEDAVDKEKIAMCDSLLKTLWKKRKILDIALNTIQQKNESLEKAIRVVFDQDEKQILKQNLEQIQVEKNKLFLSADERLEEIKKTNVFP